MGILTTTDQASASYNEAGLSYRSSASRNPPACCGGSLSWTHRCWCGHRSHRRHQGSHSWIILSRGRTTHRQARSYSGYNRNNHYYQKKTYYTYYTKPKTYYYSSYSYGNHYGKRSAEMMDEVELNRKIREVQDTVMTDEWYMDMVEKDQDDCTKRLICEVSHKKANGKSLNDVETQIVAIFGEGLGVDTSKTTAVFFAAQAGKYWKRGGIGCDFFRRCETPVDDILAMIQNELNDFEALEESFHNNKIEAEKKMD